jgi:hypothetical protein
LLRSPKVTSIESYITFPVPAVAHPGGIRNYGESAYIIDPERWRHKPAFSPVGGKIIRERFLGCILVKIPVIIIIAAVVNVPEITNVQPCIQQYAARIPVRNIGYREICLYYSFFN